jgi:exonuclease III
MKLISLNVEGITHQTRVLSFLETAAADVLCLQEAPEAFVSKLLQWGYHTTFAPMMIHTGGEETFPEGVLLASREPHNADIHYYYQPQPNIIAFDPTDFRATKAQVVILAQLGEVTIATTHFTWGPDGSAATPEQTADLRALLNYLASKSPHVLCGDFNLPRGHNPLYPELCKHYTDTIPRNYRSSLDGTLHRRGGSPDKAFLFTDYMVDYLFTQPPYTASDVILTFGISDHAAVSARIH